MLLEPVPRSKAAPTAVSAVAELVRFVAVVTMAALRVLCQREADRKGQNEPQGLHFEYWAANKMYVLDVCKGKMCCTYE